MKLRRGCGLVLIIAVSLIAGAAVAVAVMFKIERAGKAERTDLAMNGGPPIRPVWLRETRPCASPGESERRRDEAMAEAARASVAGQSRPSAAGPVLGYAVKYFSWHWSSLNFGRCKPEQAYIDGLRPILSAQDWPHVNTPAKELRLVERMPASPQLAVALSKIAFLPHIPPRDAEIYDARPYARMLLGDQGAFARPWGAKARSEINGDTKLGTSAAYLAAGADAAAALPLIERAMASKLGSSVKRAVKAGAGNGDRNAIRSDDADRLIELAYALGKAGRAADAHSAPLLQALDHKFARSAPPFGLMAANPTELCRVAAFIGGHTAQVARAKPACRAKQGGDGRPSDYP